MIPLYDVVPTRTTPFVTVALVAAGALLFTADPTPLHVYVLSVSANAAALWLFGRAVEDRTGHGRFLWLFLASVLSSALGLLAVTTASIAAGFLTVVAFSGGVAGVMGAYVGLYRRSFVLALLPLPFAFRIVEVPAFAVMGAWLLVQAYATGTWVWTQAVAFGTGAGAVLLLRRPERLRVEWWDLRAS